MIRDQDLPGAMNDKIDVISKRIADIGEDTLVDDYLELVSLILILQANYEDAKKLLQSCTKFIYCVEPRHVTIDYIRLNAWAVRSYPLYLNSSGNWEMGSSLATGQDKAFLERVLCTREQAFARAELWKATLKKEKGGEQ